MKRALQLMTLLVMSATMWMLPGQPAFAAASSPASTAPKLQIVVDGVSYVAKPGREIVIPLKNGAPANADPRTVPAAAHFKAAMSTNRTSPIAPHMGIAAFNTNCWGWDGGTAWFTNVFGTTLGSYELDVSYNTDTNANVVTGYNRDTDRWYANEGLFWYYNTRLDVNTGVNRESARVASTIHFTGPFFQTENTEIAVDMHGSCWDNVSWYVFSGDVTIM